MASGVIRRYHLLVLREVAAGDVRRSLDFEYRSPDRSRHVTEAVYLLEGKGLVALHPDGHVSTTTAGDTYLVRRAEPADPVHVNA